MSLPPLLLEVDADRFILLVEKKTEGLKGKTFKLALAGFVQALSSQGGLSIVEEQVQVDLTSIDNM